MAEESRSRSYYDEFSETYEHHRGRGYHAMLDDLEVELVRRYCGGGTLLEAGCGTGLILDRLAPHCQAAMGVDLSAGMLSHAASRDLTVVQGQLDDLPFADDAFDTVVSFKVLAHVKPIQKAMQELARVTRPGGHMLLEFYNRRSLRGMIKQLKRPTRIGSTYDDEDVYTRLDSPAQLRTYLPAGVRLLGVRGVRVLTPVAQLHAVPVVGSLLRRGEFLAADAPGLRWLGGFIILILQKTEG
jgi:ubiquinone/menaquinone biosynthesis C-methylase UbiE